MNKIKKYKTINDIMIDIPKSDRIINSYLKCYNILNNRNYKNVMCSISGGKDSDVMLDMVYRCDQNNKVHYVFFDTGLEYQATKDHLYYLEDRYSIEIDREDAYKPIVLSVKEFGLPFLSKRISTLMNRLQKENFDFTDKTFEEHEKEYIHLRSALRWFDNDFGEGSQFNINKMKLLREF